MLLHLINPEINEIRWFNPILVPCFRALRNWFPSLCKMSFTSTRYQVLVSQFLYKSYALKVHLWTGLVCLTGCKRLWSGQAAVTEPSQLTSFSLAPEHPLVSGCLVLIQPSWQWNKHQLNVDRRHKNYLFATTGLLMRRIPRPLSKTKANVKASVACESRLLHVDWLMLMLTASYRWLYDLRKVQWQQGFSRPPTCRTKHSSRC